MITHGIQKQNVIIYAAKIAIEKQKHSHQKLESSNTQTMWKEEIYLSDVYFTRFTFYFIIYENDIRHV